MRERNKTEITTFNSIGNAISTINQVNENSIKGAYGQKEIYGTAVNINKLISSMTPERHVKNYLLNTSFEEEINYFIGNDLEVIMTNEEAYSGAKSMKLYGESTSYAYQSVNVLKGNYYTFSGYIKNTNDIKIELSYINSDNTEVTSNVLINGNSSFSREDVSIYYPEDATSELTIKIILLESGTIYVDDIQLEEGEVANKYNYIDQKSKDEIIRKMEKEI